MWRTWLTHLTLDGVTTKISFTPWVVLCSAADKFLPHSSHLSYQREGGHQLGKTATKLHPNTGEIPK